MSTPQPMSSTVVVPAHGFSDEDLEKIRQLVSPEEFITISKISAAHKAQLQNYWHNLLGFPEEFVNMLVQDYDQDQTNES